MTGTYLLADIPVQITSLYPEVHQMCADYHTDLSAEILVSTSLEEIEEEGRMSDKQRQQEGLPPYQFEAPYLETLTVYRKIATAMMDRGIMLLHGSVIAVDGEAYLFTALSGTGKSTHVRLWRNLFGPRAVMVNDDKPLVRIPLETNSDTSVQCRSIVYGTPWDGKHHLSNNISAPLKAVIYLERGKENEIHEVSAKWMFPVLMQQSFRPDGAAGTILGMQLLGALSKSVKFYDLHCNMDPEAAKVAYQGMNRI